MRNPTQALLWELWRTSRFELLIRFGVLMFMVSLLGSQITGRENDPEATLVCGIFVMVFAIASLASPTWILTLDRQQTGFSFRLGFTRPVSTMKLVAVPMAYTIETAILCYVLPSTLTRLITGASMPIVGPAVVVGCGVACLMAATWSPTTMWGKAIGFAVLVSVMLVAVAMHHGQKQIPGPILMVIGMPEYYAFAWYQYVALVAATATAFTVTVIAVDWQRHGDHLLSRFRSHGGGRVVASSERVATHWKPFRNRFVAQCWYEARRSGASVLRMSLFAPIVVLAFLSAGIWMNFNTSGVPIVWLGALLLCPFVYQIVGTEASVGLNVNQGDIQYSAFDATRALPTDQMIASKILTVAVCSLFGWIVMGLIAALHSFAIGNWDLWVRLGHSVSRTFFDVPGYWWLAGLSNAMLLYIASSSMILAFVYWIALHPKTQVGVAVGMALFPFLAIWDARNDWAMTNLWVALGYAVAIASVIACLVALKMALAAGCLGTRLFSCTLGLWLIYVVSTIAICMKAAPAITLPIPTVIIFMGAAGLLFPLAATAMAPLALDAHRHA